MQVTWEKIVASIKSRHQLALQRNVLSYGVCLLIAIALWFLNALNKTYVTEITYPVKYTDFPKGKLLVSELPEEMTLEIKAHGFALLRYKINTAFQPIIFNVNAYSNGIIEKEDLLSFTVNMAEVKDRISSQLTQDIELLNIKPATLSFEFSRFKTKTLPVIPRLNYTLQRQHILKDDVRLTPSAIEVSGPASIIDTLRALYTQPVEYKNLSKDIDRTLRLEGIEDLQTEVREVRLQIGVERYTESHKTVRVEIRNLPGDLRMRLFPSSIDVTFGVGLSQYDAVTDTSFQFYVDYNEVAKSPNSLTVHRGKSPRHIKDFKFSPEAVEYLIEKNK